MLDPLATTLADCIPDAVVVLDGDARVVHLNRAAESALGWPREALVGQPVETIVPERLRRPEGMSLGEPHLRGTFLRRDGVEVETDVEISRVVAGSGERFAVVLLRGRLGDAREGTDRAAGEPPACLRPEGRGDRRRVLVVDDEKNLTRTLEVALRARYDVSVVDSGRGALAVLGQDRAFDVVLCDLMIPDLPGPDLYAEVARTMPALAGRFVFMTAGAFTERARGFLESVQNPRIEKPFHLEALEALLEECLDGPDHAVP